MIQCQHCRMTITWSRKWCEWLADNKDTCWAHSSLGVHKPAIPNLRIPTAVRRWLEEP